VFEAHHFGHMDKPREERLVRDVMIPITDYTTITEEQSVGEAVGSCGSPFRGGLHQPTDGNRPPFDHRI
jgi:hypothetical protein